MAERASPGLNEALRDIPADRVNQICSNDDLNAISKSLTHWAEVSPWLGLTEADEEKIRARNDRVVAGPQRERISVLRKWKETQGDKATYRSLIEAFFGAQRLDLVDTVIECLQAPTAFEATPPPSHPLTMSSTPPPSHSLLPPQSSPLAEYGKFLRELYMCEEDTPAASIQWPPLPIHKAFNLAMIWPDTKLQSGKVLNEYIRLTITGKVDDILHEKTPVKLGDIFKLDNKKRKVILIEGAPGSGKSTLSWNICKRWGVGELFQEYDVIILVQLRDPKVQAASTLADILPAKNRAMAEHAAEEIMACGGQKVLFLLDGWDELPSSLQSESLLSSLIRPQLLGEALRNRAVIVTSRPISSGKLHPLVTSRIEIVGFTPDELTHYFSECRSNDSRAVEALLERVEENPVVASSCYLPLNAAIIAHLFLSGNQTLPTTTHGIFTALVLCCLSSYQKKRPGIEDESSIVDSLDSLPESLQEPFKRVCRLAFLGVMEDRVTFSSTDLEGLGIHTGVTILDLLQAVPSIVSQKTSVYYNFLHLQVQELLAACHISSLPGSEQIIHFQKLFEQPRFAAVFQFYAGITRFESKRKYLSKIAFLLPTQLIPTGIRNIITNMIRRNDQQLLLSLIHCLYEANDPSLCHFVALQLEKVPGGSWFDLSRVTLSPLDCLVVGFFLSCVSDTYSGKFFAYLADSSIGDNGCRFLMKRLSKSPVSMSRAAGLGELTLNLNSTSIGDEGAQHIAELLGTTGMVLQKLDFSGNPIGEPGLKSIAEALLTNSSVVELRIGHHELSITEESGPVLKDMLQRNNTLKHLRLLYNDLADTGVMFIAEGLKQNSSLTKLDLSYCNIGDESVAHLGDGLVANESLALLSLQGNKRISERGLSVLVECLKTYKRLTELLLPSQFESTGVQYTVNAERERKIKIVYW